MGQGITVDISARVTGYEASLKQLQTAMAKLDPGADISKNLTRAFKDAESQVKALSKNMFPKATSDSQIDSIIEKTNRAGEAIQRVAQLMRSVNPGDLNLSALGSDFESLRTQIVTLENELEGKLNAGILKVVEDSSQLKGIFSELGVDLSKADAVTLFEEISKASQKATAEVEKAEEALAKIGNEKTDLMLKNTSLGQKRLGSIEGKDALGSELNNIVDQYNNVFEQLRNTMTTGMAKIKFDSGTSSKKLLDEFFKDLTPQNLEQHIRDLVLNIQNSSNLDLKTEIYKTVFGDNYSTTNINALVKSIGLDQAYDQYKAAFQEFFRNIFNDISFKDQAKISSLINNNDLDGAVKATTQALNNAYVEISKNIQKNKEQLAALLTDEQGLMLQLNTAKQAQQTYSSAEADLKNQIEQLRDQNKNLINQIEQLKAERNIKAGAAAGDVRKAGDTALHDISGQLFEGTEAAQKYRAALEQVTAREQMVGKIQGVVQRWFSIYAAIRMVGNAIRSVISTVKELDSTITEIAIVTKMDQNDLWGQMGKYTELARNYAASISGVYKVSQLYYQQGLQSTDVMALTEQTLKMARISGLDYAEATDYMTNAIRSFKMEMTDAQNVVDVYSAIAASSATSVTELATAMSKTASSAQAVGASFENTTAMMAVMIEATRESPENIGSAMKSIISRYGELKEKKTGTDAEGEEYSLNKVDTALQSVGLSIHDANGEFRDFDDVIMELASKWDTIDKNTQRYIATVMAGNRQQSRFLALVSSYDRLKQLSAEAANSEDASQLQFLKTLDSVEAKTQQIQTSLQSLYTSSGVETLYKTLLDIGNRMVKTFADISNKGDWLTMIGKIGATFTNLAVLVTNAFNFIKTRVAITKSEMLTKAQEAAAKEMETADESADGQIRAEQRVTEALTEEEQKRHQLRQQEMTNAITTAQKRAKTEEEKTRQNYRKQLKEQQKIRAYGMIASALGTTATGIAANMDINTQRGGKAALTGIGSLLSGVGTGMMIGGPAGAAMGAITALPGIIEAVGMAIESVDEKVAKFKDNITQANNKKIIAKDELTTLKAYKDQLAELESHQYDSAESKKEYLALSNEIASSYPQLISYIDEEGNKIVQLGSAYDNLVKSKENAFRQELIKTGNARINAASDANTALSLLGIDFESQKDAGSTIKTVAATMGDYALEGISAPFHYGINQALQATIGWQAPTFPRVLRGLINRDNNGYFDLSAAAYNSVAPQLADTKFENLDYGKNSSLLQYKRSDVLQALYGKNNFSADLYVSTLKELNEINLEAYDKYKGKRVLANGWGATESILPMLGAVVDTLIEEGKNEDEINKVLAQIDSELKINGEALQYRKDAIKSTLEKYRDKQIEAENLELFSAAFSEQGTIAGTSYQLPYMQYQFQKQWEEYINPANEDYEKNVVKNDKGGIDYAQTWSKFSLYYEEFYQKALNAYKIMIRRAGDNTLDDLESMMNEPTIYSANDWKNLLNRVGEESNIGQFIKKYIQDNITDTMENYKEAFRNLGTRANINLDTESSIISFIDNIGTQYIPNILSQYETILKNKSLSNDQKQAQIEGLDNIYKTASDITDKTIQKSVLNNLQNADFTSLKGIFDVLKVLGNIKGLDLDESGLRDAINGFKGTLQVNLTTEFESLSKEYTEGITEFEKTLSSASKGMDYATAAKLADTLGVTLSDFRFTAGKYYYDSLKDIEDYYIKVTEENKQALEDVRDKQKADLQGLFNDQMRSEKLSYYGKSVVDIGKIALEYAAWTRQNNLISTTDDLTYWDQFAKEKYNFTGTYQEYLDQLNPPTFMNGADLESLLSDTSQDITEKSLKPYESLFSKHGIKISDIVEKAQEYRELIAEHELDANTRFEEWLLSDVDEQYKAQYEAVISESDTYFKDLTARAQLSSGNISGFLDTTLGKITPQQYEIHTTEYYKDQAKKDLGQGATYEQIMTRAKEIADAENAAAAAEAQKVAEDERKSLIDAIAGGEVDNLPDQLKSFAKLIYDTYHATASGILTSVTTAMKGGTNQIFVDEKNIQMLQSMKDAGKYLEIKEGEENIPLEIGDVVHFAEAVIEGRTSLNNWIVKTYKSEEERLQALQDYHAVLNTQFTDASNLMSKESIVGFNDLTSYFSKYNDQITTSTMFDEEGEYSDIFKAQLERYGLEINKLTGDFVIKDQEQYLTQLQTDLEQLAEEGSTQEQRNEIQKRITDAKNNINKNRAESSKKLLQNYKSFSTDELVSFANAFNLDFNKLKNELAIDNQDGTFKLNITAFQNKIKSLGDKITDEMQSALDALISGIADDYLNNISTAMNYSIKGTTKQADMQSFVNMYNELLPDEKIDISAFRYDEIADQFKVSDVVLNKYIEAQRKELTALGVSNEDINKYITDQTVTTLQQSMDIISILSDSNTKTQKEAISKLRQNVKTYFTSELLDIQDQITELYKKDDAAASMEEASQYYTQAQELQTYLNDRLEAINTIVDTIKQGGEKGVEALLQLKGNEVTSEEISAVYYAQRDRVRTALQSLESGAGTIVNGLAARIAEVSEGISTQPLPDGSTVITAVSSMVDAYSNIYHIMSIEAGDTQAELNSVYAKMLNARDQGNTDAIAAMNDAMGMTFEALGELLAKYGKENFSSLEYALEHASELGGITQLGNGQIRLEDFNQFAKQMNWTVGGEAYVEAQSAYRDSVINEDRKIGKKIFESIKSISSAKIGDKINLTYLSSALEDGETVINNTLAGMGATIKDGILEIQEDAKIEQITAAVTNLANSTGNLITSELAELKDAISEFLSKIAGLIKSGISGNLKHTDAAELSAWAKTYANINNLNFTNTANGLKLSQQSAISLYNALKNIDKVQASLVFDELNNSLKENNENYATISAIVNRIQDLKNVDSDVPDARKQEYAEELALAKEILAVRSTSEDEGFNFMSNKIPAAQNNPINYYNNWAQAFQKLDAAMKQTSETTSRSGEKIKHRGLIDYQDWYNIVTEMNNLAEIGGDIELGAYKLDGSAEKAAELIQAGADALTVDSSGNVKVALSDIGQLGIDFAAGAKGMASKVDAGIQAMAQSQVDMLDGLIAMLETIVAMQQLGDITGEDTVIDLGDIFAVTNGGEATENIELMKGFTQKFLDSRDKLVKYLDENDEAKGIFEKTKVKIGNEMRSMYDMMTMDFSTLFGGLEGKEKEQAVKAYQGLLNGLYQAAISGDYNLDNIAGSLQTILNSQNIDFGEGFTLDVGDITYTIQNGVVVKAVDWGKEQAKQILERYKEEFGTEDEAKEKILSDIQNYLNGKTTETLTVEEVVQLRHATLIKHDKDKGNYIETPDGKKVYSKTDRQGYNALLAKAFLQDQAGLGGNTINITEEGKATTTVNYGVTEKVKFTATASIGQDGKGSIEWTDEGNKHTGKTQEELLGNIFMDSDEWKALGTTKGETYLNYKDKFTSWVYAKYGVHLRIKPEILKEGETITNPAEDPDVREAVLSAVKSNEKLEIKPEGNGYIDVKLSDKVHLKLNAEDVQYDSAGNYNKDLMNEALLSSIGLDSSLGETISAAIANAFANENVSESVSSAFAKGLEKAFGSVDGKPQEVLIPEITLKPTTLNIDTAGATTSVAEGTTYPELSIESLIALVKALILSQGWTTPDESGLTKPSTLTDIELLNATVKALKLLQGWTTPDETGLVKPVSAEDIESLEVLVKMLKLKADEGTPTTETGVVLPTQLQKTIASIEAVINELKIITNERTKQNETGIKVPPSLSKSINQLIVEVAALFFTPSEAAQAAAQKGPTTEDLGISSNSYTSEDEIEFTQRVKLKYSVETDEDANSIIQTRSGLFGQTQKGFSDHYSFKYLHQYGGSYTNEFEKYGLSYTDRWKENAGWNVQEGSSISNYINSLETLAATGQKLGQVDFANLESLKGLKINGKVGEQLENIYNLATTNAADAESNMQSVKEILESGIDVSNLDTAASALERIASAVQSLAGAPWATIASGIDLLNAPSETPATQTQTSTNIETPDTTDSYEANAEAASTAAAANQAAAEASNEAASASENAASSAENAAGAQDGLADSAAGAGSAANAAAPQITGVGNASTIAGGRASTAASAIEALAAAISNIPAHTTHDITLNLSASVSESSGKGNVSLTSMSPTNISALSFAKGKARAGGQSTLMGELGPELVVSNGSYFLVGQSGAEFVDLAPDAIVFNHKQTASLFSNGRAGRGKPITNENNAISWAKGNINGGPAQASASAALAALKQLRAQWQALANLSAQDLAGTGGGGGGGGGGDPKAFIKELEKWYDWLQQIAQLEKEITLEEAKRTKYQSDMVARGKEYFTSQKESLELLQEQITVQKSLSESQEAYFEKRKAELNQQSAFSALYGFSDSGQLYYKDVYKNNKSALEWLSDLAGRNATTGEANYTAEEQYNKLVDAGFGFAMKYDSSGNEIKQEGTDWYNTAVQAFWDKIEADKQEMQTLHDSVEDAKKKIYELESNQNEILKEIEDNQITVEQKVLKAVEESRQREIDELEKQRSAIEKSAKDMIDGLSDQLNKEKELYNQQNQADELSKLQRQLSILQRSGGSQAQIADLQKQIADKQQSLYFDTQQKQIDALQEASDNELERLDHQIEIMKETLDYQKEYGLLWNAVYEQLQKSPADISAFIKENTKEYWGQSPTELVKTIREDLFEIERFKQFQATVEGGMDVLTTLYGDEVAEKKAEKKKKEEEEEAARKAEEDKKKQQQQKSSGGGSGGSKVPTKKTPTTSANNDKKWVYDDKTQGRMVQVDASGNPTGVIKYDDAGLPTYGTTRYYEVMNAKLQPNLDDVDSKLNSLRQQLPYVQQQSAYSGEQMSKQIKNLEMKKASYEKQIKENEQKIEREQNLRTNGLIKNGHEIAFLATGGLNDYTGLAMLHGTKAKPEAVLNSEQTRILRQNILSNRPDSLISLLRSYNEAYQGLSASTYDSISNNSTATIIEHAEVNLNIEKLANDYDSKRAANTVMAEMLRIASKTSANNSVRR